MINYQTKLKPSTGGRMPPKETFMTNRQISNFSKNLFNFVPENANDFDVITSIETVARDHLQIAYRNLKEKRSLERSDLAEVKKLLNEGISCKHKRNNLDADAISLKRSIDQSHFILKSIRKTYASIFKQDIEEIISKYGL